MLPRQISRTQLPFPIILTFSSAGISNTIPGYHLPIITRTENVLLYHKKHMTKDNYSDIEEGIQETCENNWDGLGFTKGKKKWKGNASN